MARRGRGSRFTNADCPTCGDRCEASDRSPDAHRMWAQRHADRTGHITHVTVKAIRAYYPRPTEAGACPITGLKPCPWHPDGGNHPEAGAGDR